MPVENQNIEIHSDEVQDIIGAVPSWIVRWGITVILSIIIGILIISAFIKYPDIVRTRLKINSVNSPKTILAKQSGKLISILVKENQLVTQHQILALFESTADAEDVIKLSEYLKKFQGELLSLREGNVSGDIGTMPTNLQLGEIQGDFQTFYQDYIQYRATQRNGYYPQQIAFLENEIKTAKAIKNQIHKQREIQVKEYNNAENDYRAYSKLYEKKVISASEFRQKENAYLSSKYPMHQSATADITNTGEIFAKQREISVLQNTILEQQAKFVQSLNQCINACDKWIQQYTLRAPQAGHVTFGGIIQANQTVDVNQEVFIVNPGNSDYFGEVQIPQHNMGKIYIGQTALVKLHSFPFEQYGLIRGKLSYISDVPYRDSVFFGKVKFEHFENEDKRVQLKTGMLADIEIITQESSLLERFIMNFKKLSYSLK